MLKENNCQRIILYPVKLIFRNEGNLNVFSGKGQENLSSIDLHYKNTFSSSGWKKIFPNTSIEPQEGMKNARKGKYVNKYFKISTA